jgi:hypothetical protein
MEQSVPVTHPENTNISPEKVMVLIPVEKFTEKELTLPVQVIHLPEDVNLKLFPPNVKITVMVGLSEYEEVSSRDFQQLLTITRHFRAKITLKFQLKQTRPIFN